MSADTTLAEVRSQVVILAVALALDDERLTETVLDRLGTLLGITDTEVDNALRVWQEHRPQEDVR